MYANSLDPDKTPNLFDTRTTFSPTLSNIEALWKLKKVSNLTDKYSGLRVKKKLTFFASGSFI